MLVSREVLELSDGRSRLVVTPENGGGIARFDALVTGRAPVALLRPWDGAGPLGCELLIPWSNRISGGGFEFDGRFHAVEPNIAGEALPIHGDGFQKPWRVAGKTATEIELILDHGSIGPYRYVASIVYELQDRLAERDAHGGEPGFDPACPMVSASIPGSPARRHVAAGEGRARLARGRASSADRDGAGRRASGLGLFQRRFAARPAGSTMASTDGTEARKIVQPEDGIALSVQASPLLDVFIVYSPSPDAGFFCFEPVSHPVDAHHGEGLTVLERARA